MIEVKERATIETKGFSLDFGNNKELKQSYEQAGIELPDKDDGEIDKNVQDLGKYPVVWIDGVMIESINMKELTLFNNGFMPSLKLKFTDPTSKLIDDNFPIDNSIISIFKKSTVKDLMGIKMDFKVTDFKIIKGRDNFETLTYEIDAIMDINQFYLMNFEAFEGTSYNVIKDLMVEMGLGFASNVSNSNDDMTWVNPANYRIEFIKDIISKSYIDDDTFLFGYIDFYYNFNYVDIETQMKEDISNQMNLQSIQEVNKDTQDKEVPLILTNNKDKQSTNLHIQKYTLINSSTSINLEYGYRHFVNYYNKTNDELKKYALDNITDDNGNSIVMKGNDEDNVLYDEMVSDTWMGKLDEDNVHENFLHSALQNKNNLKFLQKLKMTVKMSRVNYGLYRFQKVLVELYNFGKIDKVENSNKSAKESEKGASEHDDKIINKLSGEWVITAINLTFSKSGGGVLQELTLVKRELTKEYTFPRREDDESGQEKKKKRDNQNQKETKNQANASDKVSGSPPSIQDALDLPPGTYNYTNK